MLYSFDHHATTTATAEQNGPTEEELMLRIQALDATALEELYGRLKPLLRVVINRTLNNDSDTDDVFQEVMGEIWRMAHTFSPEKGKALGWIITLARRRAIDRLRRKTALQRAEERLTEVEMAEHRISDEPAEGSDRAALLADALQTLPTAQREALEFAFYRGMSQRQIAAHTGIALGTIKTRLELGLRKVRDRVLAMGNAEDWLRD